jgi:hypothetical protein
MRTEVTDGVDHLGSQQRGRQPRIHRRGHAVLAYHQTVNRGIEGVLQHLNCLDVIDAQHLPFGRTGRRTDRGGCRDISIVGNLIHRNQFGLTDAHGRCAEHPSMIRPAAAARGKYRPAADGGLDVL